MKFETRGPEFGQCNICGEQGKLSEDHTPPKGSVKITGVLVNTLTEILNIDKPSKTHRHLQNGIKFRSLCKKCNNTRLGSNYDVALNQFSQNVNSFLNSSVDLPSYTHVRGKPQKIARAVYGHLLAIGIEKYCSNDRYDLLRDWFCDETMKMPDCMTIYYWPYPYQKQFLIREARLRDLTQQNTSNIWLMKYFPLSFLIVWDNPDQHQFQTLANFERWKNLTDDKEVEMPLYLRNIPSEFWPEVPTKNTILAFDSELAIGAAEFKTKKKKLYRH